MSQYLAKKKAINRRRDAFVELLVDSRIKLANKPTTHGEFYDYVTDLDHPAPKAQRPSAQASKQAKPAVATQATQQPVVQPVETVQTQTEKPQSQQTQTPKEKGGTGIWDHYTE